MAPHDEPVRAAQARSLALRERIARLAGGEPATPEDLIAELGFANEALQRLRKALLRSAAAHRSAAAAADQAGRTADVARHLELAGADEEAALQVDAQ